MKKGADFPIISSLSSGIAKHLSRRQDTIKVHVLNGHGTFRILVLACEIGDFELRRTRAKSSMLYFMSRKTVVAQPQRFII